MTKEDEKKCHFKNRPLIYRVAEIAQNVINSICHSVQYDTQLRASNCIISVCVLFFFSIKPTIRQKRIVTL